MSTSKFLSMLLSTPLVLGGGSNTITFYQADVSCMISRLPGGGGFASLNGVATCANPVGIDMFKNGRFRNGLLSQTITLGLNLRICDIGNTEIKSPYMVTYGGGSGMGCCSTTGVDQNTARVTTISVRVFNYLKARLGHNPTFNELYAFANQALAGVYKPTRLGDPQYSEIAGAEDAINSTFAGCRILAGWSNTNHLREADAEEIAAASEGIFDLSVKVFPNPFSNQSTIEIRTDADYDEVIVEVYNVNGAKVRDVYHGSVESGATYSWPVEGAALAEGMYIYRIIADGNFYNGKMLLIRQ
jgi:hypothetical protein